MSAGAEGHSNLSVEEQSQRYRRRRIVGGARPANGDSASLDISRPIAGSYGPEEKTETSGARNIQLLRKPRLSFVKKLQEGVTLLRWSWEEMKCLGAP